MKKWLVFAALMLALCLVCASVAAEEADFSEIAGEWYTEEISMTLTEDGRFILGWNDGDWTGSMQPDLRTTPEGDEYYAFLLVLDDPEVTSADKLELVPDYYHPGKITLYRDGTPHEDFYDVPVYVMEMDEEELEYYEPYYFIDDADGEEPAVIVMITLLRPATDVAVMKMYNQEFNEDGELGFNADALDWWEMLDSQERIVVTHVFEGDLPDLGIHFVNEDEIEVDFAVEISGEDGALILTPLPASNG